MVVLPPFPIQRLRLAIKPLWLLGSLGASALVQAQETTAPTAAERDWVSLERLTDAQKSQIPTACCGLYLEPPLPAVLDPSRWDITGDNTNTDTPDLIEILGNVNAIQGDVRVKAERARYDENQQTFTADGNIELRQPGLLLVGEKAVVEQIAGTAEITNASYVLHAQGVRGSADSIVYRDNQQAITIDNGVYTRCEPSDDAWLLQGQQIELNQQTGMGTAVDVTLRIKGVPVLYLPWIRFPITDQRLTGFLAPVMGNTNRGGLDLATPYYLNLAPHYDATLTPRLQANRGLMMGVETRYAGLNWQQRVNVNYLPDDKLFDSRKALIPTSDSPPQAKRWAADYDMVAALGKGWSANLNYRDISDFDYFQDFGNDGLNSTTQSFLYRGAALNYRDAHWAFGASTQDLQIIDPNVSNVDKPYRILPRLTLDGFNSLRNGFEYGINTEYTQFERDLNPARFSATAIANGVLVTGSRFAATPFLSWPLGNSYSFFTPTVKYKYAAWNLDDQAKNTSDTPSRGVASANIDSGLFFEKQTSIGGSNFRQTLEPRVFYLYNQYEDQRDIPLFDTSDLTFSFNQLFRDDRFSGKDRVGDTRQVTVALSTRLYTDNGTEKASFSLGQIQYLRDRRVTLQGAPGLREQRSHSALVSEASYQLAQDWRLRGYAEWNQYEQSLDVGNIQLQYQSEQTKVLNLAYRLRDMPAPIFTNGLDRRIKQSDVALHWPLSPTWNVVARWNYDYSNNRTLEGLAGLEYSNCCWNVRVVARRWLDNDALFYGIKDNNTGVFVQFELKGLGSILGGNVSSVLNNGIRGFRDRNNARF